MWGEPRIETVSRPAWPSVSELSNSGYSILSSGPAR